MVRKLSVLVAVLVSAVMILSACAPTAPAPETPAAEAKAPTKITDAAAEAPVPVSETLSGTLTLAGSTTVQPLAEKAGEAFMDINPDVTIEVQGGGSSVGITAAADGTADIGNASRALKEEEMKAHPDFQVFTVAKDGIAIVVNPKVKLDNLTKEQIKAIFSGEVTNFKEVGGPDAPITVVSREEGSGTRTAFEEMVLEYKDANGEKKIAPIVSSAILQNSNGAVRTTVAETPNSIAYLSFGYLDKSIATVNVEGIQATVDNVLNGTYPISRPLNMITKGDPKPLAKAFIDFLLSDAGQAIVVEEGFITVIASSSPAAETLSGTLTLAGSTTVQPLAEKAGEAFMDANPDVTIEVQGGGSSVGVTAAADGTADIGNISREPKKEELEANPDFQVFTVAKDGIAIVVNPKVKLDNLTKEQVRDIFSGKITNFKEVGGPDAPITVVSREEGSGTRTAFQELVMQYKDASGNKAEDPIVASAILQNSNGAVRTTVAETPNSIAFLSFGYLDNSIATVNIEGIQATVDNVLNGTYPISRPLNMITKGDPKPLAKAFIDFLLSDAGQAIVVEEGFITVK